VVPASGYNGTQTEKSGRVKAKSEHLILLRGIGRTDAQLYIRLPWQGEWIIK
jgi:hypothetical protein